MHVLAKYKENQLSAFFVEGSLVAHHFPFYNSISPFCGEEGHILQLSQGHGEWSRLAEYSTS